MHTIVAKHRGFYTTIEKPPMGKAFQLRVARVVYRLKSGKKHPSGTTKRIELSTRKERLESSFVDDDAFLFSLEDGAELDADSANYDGNNLGYYTHM